MFSSGPNYQKLKTNLRLALNRLKLLEKKKTELALKARKEIADYIEDGKAERARIRVEHIIREDYIVEAMELVEMYCDLLLARFGLIEQMKELDDGLAESISSLIWVAPRLQTDVPELKLIGDQLTSKYGKPYGVACRENSVGTVSPKLMQKLSVQAPPKLLVEKYLIEISKIYSVHYEPDHAVFEGENEGILIDVGGTETNSTNNLGGDGGAAGGGGGGGGMPTSDLPPMQEPGGYPYNPPAYSPFQYPPPSSQNKNNFVQNDFGFNIPPKQDLPQFPMPPLPPGDKELNVNNLTDVGPGPIPKPAPRSNPAPSNNDIPDLPDLPSVPFTDPSDFGGGGRGPSGGRGGGGGGGANLNNFPKKKSNEDNSEIDFDDLTRRFEELKKRK